MKRLILMRHAKSSWAEAGQRDIDRPLNDRGARDAARMGVWMREGGFIPDLALVSVATRTRQTWEGVGGALGAVRAEFVELLYHADPRQMRAALGAVEAETVLLIGHQPGIGEMALRLLSSPSEDADFERYPTAATGIFDFEIEAWSGLDWKTGKLVDFTVPRRLG